MKIFLLSALILLLTLSPVRGEVFNNGDSTKAVKRTLFTKQNLGRLILPAPFILTGLAMYGKPGERFQ